MAEKKKREIKWVAQYPDVAETWDYVRNAPLIPSEVSTKRQEPIWWTCPKGHSYQMTLLGRLRSDKCPVCRHDDGVASRKKNKYQHTVNDESSLSLPDIISLVEGTSVSDNYANNGLSNDEVLETNRKKAVESAKKGANKIIADATEEADKIKAEATERLGEVAKQRQQLNSKIKEYEQVKADAEEKLARANALLNEANKVKNSPEKQLPFPDSASTAKPKRNSQNKHALSPEEQRENIMNSDMPMVETGRRLMIMDCESGEILFSISGKLGIKFDYRNRVMACRAENGDFICKFVMILPDNAVYQVDKTK